MIAFSFSTFFWFSNASPPPWRVGEQVLPPIYLAISESRTRGNLMSWDTEVDHIQLYTQAVSKGHSKIQFFCDTALFPVCFCLYTVLVKPID